MDHKKIDTAYLDSPRRELSVRGLKFVIAFWFVGELTLCVCVLEVQSVIQLYPTPVH